MSRILAALLFLSASAAHADDANFFDFKEPSIPLQGRSAWGAGAGTGQGYISWRDWLSNKRAIEVRLGLYDNGDVWTDSSNYTHQFSASPSLVGQFNLVQSGSYVLIQWTASLNASYTSGFNGYGSYSVRRYTYGAGIFTGPAVEIFLPVFHNLSLSGSTGIAVNYSYSGVEGSSVGQNGWRVDTLADSLSPWTLGLNLYY